MAGAFVMSGGDDVAKPQHRTPEYRAAYKAQRAAQAASQWLWCVEPICKRPTRDIAPWDKASISHDPSGTVILGDSHRSCNLSEAAIRGNRMRARRPTVPLTPNRWVL